MMTAERERCVQGGGEGKREGSEGVERGRGEGGDDRGKS